MKIEEIIQDKLNRLERSLSAQAHLTNPTEFATQIASFSIYIHLMKNEDRDYLNCASYALEEEMEWLSLD
jgi:sRNA-binding regulator protein Hfq